MKESHISLKDISGSKFGRLTVIEFSHKDKYGHSYWTCRCECGNTKTIYGVSLICGDTKSCGCLRKSLLSERNTKTKTIHGESRVRLYNIWINIIQRTTNKNTQCYCNYGRRGITVCNEWLDYINFRDWALANGYSDNLTIDRTDNNGNYEPNNCRWVTPKEQANNKRNNRLIEHKGEVKTIAQWSELYDIPYNILNNRLYRGWGIERALNEPVNKFSLN